MARNHLTIPHKVGRVVQATDRDGADHPVQVRGISRAGRQWAAMVRCRVRARAVKDGMREGQEDMADEGEVQREVEEVVRRAKRGFRGWTGIRGGGRGGGGEAVVAGIKWV